MSPPRAFLEGLVAPAAGFRFLSRHPKLWRYVWVPVLLNAVLSFLLFAAMIYALRHFSAWMETWFSGLWRYLVFVIDVLLLVLVVALAAGAAILLGILFCSVFYSRLAAKTEEILGTPASALRGNSVIAETVDTIRAMIELALVSLGGALLPLLPGVGPPLSVAFVWYFDSFILGMRYLEFPLSLRGLRRNELRAYARAHRWHTLGLGSAVFLFTLVPVAGSLALCTAVVGATLLNFSFERSRTAR